MRGGGWYRSEAFPPSESIKLGRKPAEITTQPQHTYPFIQSKGSLVCTTTTTLFAPQFYLTIICTFATFCPHNYFIFLRKWCTTALTLCFELCTSKVQHLSGFLFQNFIFRVRDQLVYFIFIMACFYVIRTLFVKNTLAFPLQRLLTSYMFLKHGETKPQDKTWRWRISVSQNAKIGEIPTLTGTRELGALSEFTVENYDWIQIILLRRAVVFATSWL